MPDVAADAASHTGMAMVTSDGGGRYTIRSSGGTSASAPLWAALIALADQYAGRHLGFVNPALYRIARSARYHRAFHDVTDGKQHREVPAQDDHRLPGRARLGSGHRLGQPRRAGAHPAARRSDRAGRLKQDAGVRRVVARFVEDAAQTGLGRARVGIESPEAPGNRD